MKVYCDNCKYFEETGSVEFPDSIQICGNEKFNKRYFYEETWRRKKDLVDVKEGVNPSIVNKKNDCRWYEEK